jgi:elongation factor 1-alpha
VERGTLKEGDELVVAPINKVGIVKSIEAYGKPIKKAEAGETVGIGLRNIAMQDVERGDVLGSADDPPRLAEDFEAKIVLFGDVGVVKPGWSAHVHCHTAAVPVKLEAILMKYRPDSGEALEGQGASVREGTGKEGTGAPGATGGADAGEMKGGDGTGAAGADYLMKGDAALVRLKPLKPLIIESTEILSGMARFALRAGKDTLGAGSCVSVRLAEKKLSTSDDKGFSYKWQKVGKGAKDQKARKEGERRDIWGKPVKKEK